MAAEAKFGTVHVQGVPDDEPVFVLRGQDIAAYDTIMDYATNAHAAGAPQEHVEGAQAAARALRAWQQANPDRVKVPD